MPHPRAVFPQSLVNDYKLLSLKKLSAMYRSNHCTIRRWLIDRGIQIRKQGVRVKP